MRNKEFVRFMIFRTIGNFLVLFTIFGFAATFGPAVYYEASYRIARIKGVKYVLSFDIQTSSETELGKLLKKYRSQNQTQPASPSLFRDILAKGNQQILVPPNADYSLVIPKIGASQKVAKNVDPSNKDEFLPVLSHSIAHAKGTAFPGMNGTIYLFAHSADNFWNVGRYNATFYLLKDLETQDEINVFFQGKRYNYYVYEKKIVDAEDVEFVEAGIGQGERLILQTCWPPGTAWKRLLVFAKPK